MCSCVGYNEYHKFEGFFERILINDESAIRQYRVRHSLCLALSLMDFK